MITHYLLNSNIFIQSFFLGYRFLSCDGFWELLRTLHGAGRVSPIHAVKHELTKRDDELAQWIKVLPDDFFQDEGARGTQIRYAELMNWVADSSQFIDAAKNKSVPGHADPWLVSYAVTHGVKIVTHERRDPDIRKSVEIPSTVRQINVEYMSLYDFLRLVSEDNFQIKP